MCVTRAEAVTALQNIYGRVRVIFGRCKQTENSEVAQLIIKSLEKEEASKDYTVDAGNCESMVLSNSLEIPDGAKQVNCLYIFKIYFY